MARVNRSSLAWFAALLVAAVAVALLGRGCDRESSAPAIGAAAHNGTPVGPAPPARVPRHEAEEPASPASENAPTPAPTGTSEDGVVELKVTVRGADGPPVAGATVVLLERWSDDWGDVGRRGATGGDGIASFRVPDWMFRIVAFKGGDVAVCDGGTKAPGTTVTLAPGIRVRGRVVDARRAPVAGATVRYATGNWRTTGVGFWLSTSARDDGTFELPPLPTQAFDADTATHLDARAPGYLSGSASIDAAGLRDGVVVELTRGVRVRGRIVDEDGAAIENVAVRCESAGRDARARTDSAGAFDLTLPAEGGSVVAVREWATKDPMDPDNEIDHGTASLVATIPAASPDVDLGLVRLPRGAPVHGVVVGPDGSPIANATVSISLAGADVEQSETGEDGRFAFPRIGPDPHSVSVSAGSGLANVSTRREGVRGGGEELRIALTGARTVLVRFVDDAGAPLCVTHALLRWSGDDGAGSAESEIPTDALRIAPAKAGTYALTVEGRGFVTRTVEGVAVLEDRGTEVSVVLHPRPNAKANARTVRLAFVDGNGAPLPLQHAELFNRASGAVDFGEPQTWTGGPFQDIRFEPRAAGKYDLLVKVPGYEPFAVTVDVTEDDEVRIDVPLRRKAD